MDSKFLVGYKLFFGLLGFSALITEVALIADRGLFNPGNFFSFFTVQSNILAVLAFIIGAFYIFAGKKSARFDIVRGAVTFYMAVTGIVFALLLSGLEGVQLTALPWDNIVLHYMIPIAIVVDWLIDPPLRQVPFYRGILWIFYPIAYLVYSLIRGPIVGWYPYPFLDPANGGYGTILMTSILITLGGLVMIYILTRIGKRPSRKKK